MCSYVTATLLETGQSNKKKKTHFNKVRSTVIVIINLSLCVVQLIRELGNINVKKKEPPFCYPYSLKARVLVLAHLARMDVSEELDEGRTQLLFHFSKDWRKNN